MKEKKEPSGYWIQKTHLLREVEYICSSCRSSFGEPYEVCPFCGISMSSGKYDPSWVDEAEMLDIFFS